MPLKILSDQSYLNLFRAFDRLPPGHEDHYTRALLITLRLVPAFHARFLDMIRSSQKENERPLPASADLCARAAFVDTQCTLLPAASAELLSLAITGGAVAGEHRAGPSSRQARYDGVFYYPPDWLITLENKPEACNFDPRQLLAHVAEGFTVRAQEHPVFLDWQDVLAALQWLKSGGRVSELESVVLDDFISYCRSRLGLSIKEKNQLIAEFYQRLKQACIHPLLQPFRGAEPDAVTERSQRSQGGDLAWQQDGLNFIFERGEREMAAKIQFTRSQHGTFKVLLGQISTGALGEQLGYPVEAYNAERTNRVLRCRVRGEIYEMGDWDALITELIARMIALRQLTGKP